MADEAPTLIGDSDLAYEIPEDNAYFHMMEPDNDWVARLVWHACYAWNAITDRAFHLDKARRAIADQRGVFRQIAHAQAGAEAIQP